MVNHSILVSCLPGQSKKKNLFFGEYYLEDVWKPSSLLDFLNDPEISILEVDPSDIEDHSSATDEVNGKFVF
jgi:hypothetical protein